MADGTMSPDGRKRSSLQRGLDLLGAIAERGADGMSLSAAARRACIHTATAHRLLGVLVQANYLGYDPYTKRYHLSLMPYELTARAGQDLAFLTFRRRIRAAVESRRAMIGGTLMLFTLSRGEALCVDEIPGDADIRVNTLKVGSRRPLGAGGGSLALLASHAEEQRAAIIERERSRYRKYGALTSEVVAAQCDAFDACGYVVNDAVIIEDIAAVAIPVFENGALVGSTSVTDGASRLRPPRRGDVVAAMRAVVKEAGYSHGWDERAAD